MFISEFSVGLPTPAPIAVIIVPISVLDNILSFLALSTFNIFPLNGSIAWFFLSLPCFADPPAESPSTIKSSELVGSFSWQSANLPGREDKFNTPFLLVSSLAFLAASLADEASTTLSHIFLISAGFSSNHWSNFVETADSTKGLISEDTNLSFVWL